MAVMPTRALVDAVRERQGASSVLWALAAMAGAAGVVYAARRHGLRQAWRVLFATLAAAAPGVLVMTAGAWLRHRGDTTPMDIRASVSAFTHSFALYVPVLSSCSKRSSSAGCSTATSRRRVTARGSGARPRSCSRRSGGSGTSRPSSRPVRPRRARFVAIALWFVFVHVVIGLGLTLCWRRTGTLLAPALAHALIDAVRNAIM